MITVVLGPALLLIRRLFDRSHILREWSCGVVAINSEAFGIGHEAYLQGKGCRKDTARRFWMYVLSLYEVRACWLLSGKEVLKVRDQRYVMPV